MKHVLRCSCICFVLLFICSTALAQTNQSGAPGGSDAAKQTPRSVSVPSVAQDVDENGRIPEPMQGSGGVYNGIDFEKSKRPAVQQPLSTQLDGFSASDKGNAILQFEVPSDLPSQMLGEVKNVENLWNSGDHDRAIAALRDLEARGLRDIAFTIQWSVPRVSEVPIQAEWGNDVRISDRMPIDVTAYDYDAATGHLFAVVTTDISWAVVYSTNGGATWVETLYFGGSVMNADVSGACMDGYFWVGYNGGTATLFEARMRRFFGTTGLPDNGYFFQTVWNKGVAITDIAVWTNADDFNNRVYYAGILADGRVIYYFADQNGLVWSEVITGATTAAAALDASWNWNPANPPTQYFSFLSYVDNVGQLRILRNSGGWDNIGFVTEGEALASYPTAIAAYHDYVTVYYRGLIGGVNVLKYLRADDAGVAGSWFFGQAAPATSAWFDATARLGGGVALIWQEEVGEPDPCWYQRTPYGLPNYSPPQQFNEVDVVTGTTMTMNWVPPFIGPRSYGCLWINDLNNRWCYWDRLDAGCVLVAPSNCSATDSRCDLIRVRWDYFGDPCQSGFRIWRNGVLVWTGNNPNTRQWDDLVGPGTYTYEIRPWDANGNGPVCSNVGTRLAPPASPSPIQASDSRCNDVIIGWSNVANENGYRVYRNGTLIATKSANVISHTDVPGPGTYTYCVEAYNVCGASPRPCDSGRRLGPPPAPSGVTASDGGSCPSGVLITWNNVPDETGYRVYRNGTLIGTKGVNVTSHTDFGGTPNVVYSYCVEAYNACGASARPCDSGGCIIPITDCVVSRTTMNYGTFPWDQCRTESFEICNPVSATTNLTGTVSEPCPFYNIISGGGPYNLAPGQCRTVMVELCPPAAADTYTCTVETGNAACPDVFCTGDVIPPVNCIGPRVIASDGTGWNGSQVDIYLQLQQSPVDVDAFTLDLLYDTAVLRYVSCVQVDLTQNWLQVGCSENNPGEITVLGFNPAPVIPSGTSGDLVRLTFDVIGCSFPGQESILTPANLQDDFAGMLVCEGTFICQECVSDGDVNNDGSLTAGDALCCFNIALLGGVVPPSCDVPNWDCELIACDVNCDDNLTAGDALEIFNRALLGGSPSPCFAQFLGAASSAGAEVNAFAVSLKDAASSGNALTVPVMMEATRGQTAFGFEVRYDPETVKFDGLTVRESAEHWKGLGAKELEPGLLRVMGFDTEGLKGRHVTPGEMVEIAELRFEKLSDEASLGSVEWIEQRLDREAYEEPEATPERVTKLDLSRPYPNPFRDAVSANVLVPSDEVSSVRVAVYDVKGRVVRVLLNESVSGGSRQVTWDRRTSTGQQVSSGIYFLRMEVKESGFSQTRKLVVLK